MKIMKTSNTQNIRSYSEMSKLKTFEERFNYLKTSSIIGEKTFGAERLLNQKFYTSPEWRNFRRQVIIRDECRDLGLEGHDIYGRVEIHHINPITVKDVVNGNETLMDMENVICVSSATHKAIHYGDANSLPKGPIVRKPNDTCPWK